MKRLCSAFGLAVAIALSTGTALVEHPSAPDQAPGAFSDITIAEADTRTAPMSGKQEAPPPQLSNDSAAKGEDVSVDRDPAPRVPKVAKP